MFMKNKRFISIVLVISAVLLLFSLSAVSSATYDMDDSNTTSDIQNVIDTDIDDDLEIRLADGSYTFSQIDVKRNATIIGQSKGGVVISGTGTLFNITSVNVRIINLTIIGFDTGIQSNSSGLTIVDNNITTNDISINISSDGADLKGIKIENNTINSLISNTNYGAVYIYAPDYSGAIIDVSLLGNTIIGNALSNSNGVRMRAVGCDSNINFTGNNITGTYGVYLYAYRSNNTNITFVNNNITGTNYGFAMGAYISNNINITFVNNNITGTNWGVSLGASTSNNINITFVNNNITGTNGGVSLSVDSSNNDNITFVNNNITGTEYGVYLGAFSSKNANITFVNNKITGTSSYGVYLYAYSSSNNNITFDNNNIIGGRYGVYVYSYEGNLSGFNFLNNVINSTGGDGFYFFSNSGSVPTDVSDFIIRGNTIFAPNGAGLNFTGLYVGSLVNVTVEYNRILALVGVNITDFNDDSSFDYNWWGVNDISGLIFGVDTNNHYILDIVNLTSLNDVKFGDTLSFMFLVLNTTLTNDGVEYLPYFVVNGTYNGQEFVVDNTSNFTGDLTIASAGIQVINGTLDNQDVNLEFSARKGNVNVNITVTENPDGSVIITVTVTDEDGDSVPDYIVDIDVDGVTVGSVTTDENGIGSLTIPKDDLIGGNHTVTAIFDGGDDYNNATGSAEFYIKLGSNLSINLPKNATSGKKTTITGKLVDENGNPIAGANLTVVIDGKSYNVVTSADGSWSLSYTPSKAGNLTAKVYYAGDSTYSASNSSVAYTVSKGSGTEDPNPNIRLIKRANSKAVRHGNIVYMKWLTFKNFGGSGSGTVSAQVLYKNLKYKLWKVYNKKLNYKYAANRIKFKISLKTGKTFKLKLKVYRPIKQK